MAGGDETYKLIGKQYLGIERCGRTRHVQDQIEPARLFTAQEVPSVGPGRKSRNAPNLQRLESRDRYSRPARPRLFEVATAPAC
jgi:hypothetical protein